MATKLRLRDVKIGDYLIFKYGSHSDENSIVQITNVEESWGDEYVHVRFIQPAPASNREPGSTGSFYLWRFEKFFFEGNVEDWFTLSPVAIKIRMMESRFNQRSKHA